MSRTISMKLIVIVAVSLLSLPAWSQSTVAEIKSAVEEAWGEISAVSATMRVTSDAKSGVLSVKTDVDGPLLIERIPDGGFKYRAELEGQAKAGPLGIIRFDIYMLEVSDGDIRYSESRFRGNTTVKKWEVGQQQESAPGGGPQVIESVARNYDLHGLPPARVEGRDAYVIEGFPKEDYEPPSDQLAKYRWYFDQQTGMQLKVEAIDGDGDKLTEIFFENIRLNPHVPDEAFQYTPPEDVKVEDMTASEEPTEG